MIVRVDRILIVMLLISNLANDDVVHIHVHIDSEWGFHNTHLVKSTMAKLDTYAAFEFRFYTKKFVRRKRIQMVTSQL